MTEDTIIPDPRPDLLAAVTQLTQQPGADTVDFTDLDGIIGAGEGNLEAVRAVVAELKQQHPDLDDSDIDQIIGAGGGN